MCVRVCVTLCELVHVHECMGLHVCQSMCVTVCVCVIVYQYVCVCELVLDCQGSSRVFSTHLILTLTSVFFFTFIFKAHFSLKAAALYKENSIKNMAIHN